MEFAKKFASKGNGFYYVWINVKKDVKPERISEIKQGLLMAGVGSNNIKIITSN